MATEERFPEHAKLEVVMAQSQAIGEFLETSGYVLAEYRQFEDIKDPMLAPVGKPINDILAGYFKIDLNKIETEKRQMLDILREGS